MSKNAIFLTNAISTPKHPVYYPGHWFCAEFLKYKHFAKKLPSFFTRDNFGNYSKRADNPQMPSGLNVKRKRCRNVITCTMLFVLLLCTCFTVDLLSLMWVKQTKNHLTNVSTQSSKS